MHMELPKVQLHSASKISDDKHVRFSTKRCEWQYPSAMEIIVFYGPAGPHKIRISEDNSWCFISAFNQLDTQNLFHNKFL